MRPPFLLRKGLSPIYTTKFVIHCMKNEKRLKNLGDSKV
ncbi:hypothetical protein BACCAP_03423 [Pseudoflavonifractor capillosus ATCC 29799]|uniref:Uncharacterized protein n=1 Tax=Pseudoflavonifractor capillosus ATCC 29799 TaxID=411467 RepID=A6NYX1_9FIRM|nr:hypothetical protein BACCAP_03423 [Pseudoflavonifractor capillosus ATCC 29799]